ncbi:ATP-dependent RNA helicase DHX8 [Nemania sp. FL0031]|nr:ATP-dependent RNA helicase DHX8 [Nemania sp. FL0031]
MKTANKTPYRQIRALFDDETITVYQAYSDEIALAAVEQQKLSASPLFKPTRFTWIKPSWAWMMYRSGYSYKDRGQTRILALRMKHEHFRQILRQATVTGHSGVPLTEEEKSRLVRVQWDPERNLRLGILPFRSIQIGIGGEASRTWAESMIVSIEDVTEKARALKKALEENPAIGEDDLVETGLAPRERVYDVADDLKEILRMGVEADG